MTSLIRPNHPLRKKIIGIFRSFNPFLLALAATLMLVQGCSEEEVPKANEKAPDFTLKLFNGEDFTLADQKGKSVVINFFASWCVSCGEETPDIVEASREFDPEKIVFLGIAVDDTEKKAKQFMQKAGLTIPAGLDRTGEIKNAFGLYGMPTTYFIDKEGFVSYFHPGVVNKQLLRHEIDKIL